MFLNAIMLAGIGGAVVPLILHLLSRARYRNVDWGAMMFLGDANMRQQQAARLKQWILLLMRMAIVALLAMALARPVLTTTGWGSVTTPGRANVVIVLDCSASMAYAPANQETRFQSAKSAVLKILSRLGPNDRVTLLRAGDPLAARSRAQIDSTPQKIADLLADLSASEGAADAAQSLRGALNILEQRPGDRQIYWVGDTQVSTWANVNDEFAREWKSRVARSPVRIWMYPVGEGGDNTAIESLVATNPPTIANVSTNLELTVRNSGDNAIKNLPLTIIDATSQPATAPAILKTTVSIEPHAAETVAVPTTLPAGFRRLRASLDQPRGLVVDDSLDALFFAQAPLRVLVVSGDERSEPLRGEAGFFRAALTPFQSAGTPGPASSTVDVVALDQWTESMLVNRDAVVLANVGELSPNQLRALESYVSSGGGLLIAPGSLTRIDAYNDLLYRQGAGLLPAPLAASVASDPQASALSISEASHPLFRFLQGRDDALPRVSCWRMFTLAASPPRSPAVRTLVTFKNNSPLLVEMPFARGRVLLLTIPLDNDWSDFPLSKFYLPFVQSLVHYLASGTTRGDPLIVGQSATISFAERGTTGQCVVHRPDGVADRITLSQAGDAWFATYSRTDRAGFYDAELLTANGPLHQKFVAKIAPQESRLVGLDDSRIAELADNLGIKFVSPTALGSLSSVFEERIGRELWAIALVGVLLLSIAELGLARWWSMSR